MPIEVNPMKRSERVRWYPEGKSRTEQSHKKACDVNNILKRYNATGMLPQRMANGLYGDFTSIVDYQDCLNKILDAKNDFATLPSQIRKRFKNDPGLLIQFLSDHANRQEAELLGLVPRSTPEETPESPEESPVTPPEEVPPVE